MRRFLASFVVVLFVPAVAGADGDAEPDQDDVCIVAPADGTVVQGVPAAIEVEVEASNGSNLVVEEVGLRVDGVDLEGMACEGPGACTFAVELDEGEHQLRAYARRNLGPEIVSNVVTLTVVAVAGTSTGADASTSSSTSGSTGDESEASGGQPPPPPVGNGGDEAGCGCGQGRGGGWPGLLVLLLAARGHRRPRRSR